MLRFLLRIRSYAVVFIVPLLVVVMASCTSGQELREAKKPVSDTDSDADHAEPLLVVGLGSRDNPIKCDDPKGEGWYLSRLRLLDGTDISWKRDGSTGPGSDGHHLDHYTSNKNGTMYLDMYHKGYIETLAPSGYRLHCDWSQDFEYVEGVIHQWGESEPYTGVYENKGKKAALKVSVKNGIIDGAMKWYYLSGALKKSTNYDSDNRKSGKETWYYENKQIWAEIEYVNGQWHGAYNYYDKDGVLERSNRYQNGEHAEDLLAGDEE